MKNKKIGYVVVFLISLIGALIGWVAWLFVIKGILEYAKVKKQNLFSKWYSLMSLILIILLLIIYASYNYFVVTPITNRGI